MGSEMCIRDSYERKKSDMKRTSESRAFVAKSDKQRRRPEEKKELVCWACGNSGHRSTECRKKRTICIATRVKGKGM